MVENAGRALAARARDFLGGSLSAKRVIVLAGKGNNGAGGIVSARHMHNWGADVVVVLANRLLRTEAAKQLSILRKMPISVFEEEAFSARQLGGVDLIIDSLLGYNQKGNPQSNVATLVTLANSSGTPVIALDIPTGLDPDTGRANSPCIKATQTLTLALPKTCFLSAEGMNFTGDLYLVDISVPRNLYMRYGIRSEELFEKGSIVRLNYTRDQTGTRVLTAQE